MGRCTLPEDAGVDLKLSGCLASATSFVIGRRRACRCCVSLEKREVHDVLYVLAYLKERNLFVVGGNPITQDTPDAGWFQSHINGIEQDGFFLERWYNMSGDDETLVFA